MLMRFYVLGDISLQVAASSPLNRPLGILEERQDRLPPNLRYEELLRNLADVRHKRAVAVAELVARALTKKEVAAEQPNRAAPITEADMAVIEDEPEGDPDLSEIFVANDATAEKILQQRRDIMEEEQEKIASAVTPMRVGSRHLRNSAIELKPVRIRRHGWMSMPMMMRRCGQMMRTSAKNLKMKKLIMAQKARPPSLVSPSLKRPPLRRLPKSHFVRVQYLEDQYPEYEYRMAEIDGAFQQVVQLGNKELPLHFASGWELNGGHLFFAKPLKDCLTQLSKVVRQHDQFLGREVDEDGYADLDEVARCFGLNHRSAPPLTVKDL